MGCASSKVLGNDFEASEKGNVARAISMPTSHPHGLPDDFHIVALTSSTYGFLKVESPNPPEDQDPKDAVAPHSVKDVLSKLESKTEAGPQSWLEVSSMLENLKPDLETPASPAVNKKPVPGKLKKTEQPDSIDINEIMRDLDEETGLVKPKSRANLRKRGMPFDKSLSIHTLEELDKRTGGKENHVKNSTIGGTMLIPVDSIKPVPDTAAKNLTPKGDDEETRGGVIGKDGELFDADFLESYKNAITILSEDDWKALQVCQDPQSVEQKQGMDTKMKHVAVPPALGSSPTVRQSQTLNSSEGAVRELETPTFNSDEKSVEEHQTAANIFTQPAAPAGSPLDSYEELCPPRGKNAVVLYTTSLRGIRKTYEDCNKVREILQGYGVLVDERDVSMHLEYRNELRELMERVVTVPRLFIKGRYIGGSEQVCKLLAEGQLAPLFDGSTTLAHGAGKACDGCAGARFVPCLECSGSCKLVNEGSQIVRCPHCNENGLIQCPICA